MDVHKIYLLTCAGELTKEHKREWEAEMEREENRIFNAFVGTQDVLIKLISRIK